jgi:hypothetical protein
LRTKVLEFRVCPHCSALMPSRAGKCTRCSLSPAALAPFHKRCNRLRRAVAHLRERRYARKKIPVGSCPNCCEQFPHKARRCLHCDWIKNDEKRAHSAERSRRLSLSLRAALTYEKKIYCTRCACVVRTTTNFCPVCQDPFPPEASPASALCVVGAFLRRERMKKAAERATLCPNCEIYLPVRSAQCYCCGWSHPASLDRLAVLRDLVHRAGEKLARPVRRAALEEQERANLCPNCDVCVPCSNALCMICGWKPPRRLSLRESFRIVRAQRQRQAVVACQQKLRICEECDLALHPGQPLCMVCGWEPAPNTIQRLRSMRLPARKKRVRAEHEALCPNCRTAMEGKAGRCGHCGWDRNPARSWARRPQMIWLVPICLVLYCTLLTTCLQMADPTGGLTDRYGRRGSENQVRPVSARKSR